MDLKEVINLKLFIGLAVNSLALLVTDLLLAGLTIATPLTTVLAAIVIGLINTFIRPVLVFLTAPLNLLTLGLFSFVINAIVLSVTAWILGSAFQIDNFWWAILAAAVLSVVSTILAMVLKDLGVVVGKSKGKRKK